MDRFINKEKPEVLDFGIGAMLPAGMKHIDYYETDYVSVNNEYLHQYFPGLFDSRGKSKKKMKIYVAEDED